MLRIHTFAASFDEYLCQGQAKASSATSHHKDLAFKIKVAESLRLSLGIR